MDRKIYDTQPPHDSAVLRTPLHEREPSAAAKRFLLPERDTYGNYVEAQDEADETLFARLAAFAGEGA